MLHFMVIAIIFTLTNSATPYPETLRFVSIIYRHGDRAPERTFPTNPIPVSEWPNGLGALTSTGIRQSYQLGKYIRERYQEFISDSYVASEIRVRSTDIDRTLRSAEANLAGLYPPSGYQKWSDTVLWQPIPVHTVPLHDDNLIYMHYFCPRMSDLYKEYLVKPQTLTIVKENQQFFKYLTEKTGVDVNLINLYSIGDVMLCQDLHGYSRPPWFNDTLRDRIMKIVEYENAANFSTVESTRLTGGSLLKEVTENMVDKTTNVNSDVKIFMYSTHDQMLGAFLATLGINGFSFALSYVATILVELHESPSQGFYVKVFSKTLSSEPRILTVKGCTAECPLKKFQELTKKYIPIDLKKECEFQDGLNDANHNSKLPSTTETRSSLQSESRSSTIGFMVLCYLSGVVTVLVVMSIVMCVRRKGYRAVSSM